MGQIVTVNFRGTDLYGFRGDDGDFIALKPIVEAMGLAWHGQFERVKRDPILQEGIRVMRTPFGGGGGQEVTCLKLELLQGWLFTIDSSRIKDQTVRERVLLYQRECYVVLHDHFTGGGRASPVLPLTEKRPFPDWPFEEMRTKRSVVDTYRLTINSAAAQWIMPQLGFPMPPPDLMPTPSVQYELPLDAEISGGLSS